MIELIKLNIKELIEQTFLLEGVIVEEPKKGHADLAIPLFAYAKLWQVSPMVVYEKFLEVLKSHPSIDRIEFMNGFLNIYLERNQLSKDILNEILDKKDLYGSNQVGTGQTVAIDYSSPNIAKSFTVGHLRSTMIGNAIKHIYRKCGYQVIGINHLGDWGTQFGKMIVAYELWGNEAEVKANPITELQKLYVKFHDAEQEDPSLEQKARDVFRDLELGNERYLKLWAWFKEESMREFMKMYELLGVDFESFDGESFYNDKMDAVVEEMAEKGILKVDEGATIVELGENIPPALIKKSDGATLYVTRDVAAILYRYHTYDANHFMYVVGNEQQLHFKQLKMVTDRMGYNFNVEHVNFGLVLVDGKKMSTRGGKSKRLEDVILQAIDEAKEAIHAKNPNLKNQDEVAKAVGVGAIIFNDLKNEKHLDVDFNLSNMLKFEGQTGPYLQYSGVRIESILKDQILKPELLDPKYLAEDHYFEVIKLLAQFPSVVLRAKETSSPNLIARYTLTLAQGFNSFYGKQRIIVEDEGHKQTNLIFAKSIQIVLNEGLRLLGIQSLKEM
jgi:arginyl-tRNA synthetase